MTNSNHFQTLKIELLNHKADGWLSESFKDIIIASYSIRIPDLTYEPFAADGSISLPIPELPNYRSLGLTPL
jgi:hypothetical protein